MTGWFNIVGLVGDRRLGRLRRRVLPERALGLYERRASSVMDFADDEHILLARPGSLFFLILLLYTLVNIFARPGPGAVQQHLRRLAPARRGDRHRRCSSSSPTAPERGLRLHRADQQLRAYDGSTAASASGSSCCPSASCSRCTRRRATTPPRTPPRRPRARRSRPRKGVWRSVFWSGRDRLVRAAGVHCSPPPTSRRVNDGARLRRRAIFTSALDPWAAKMVLLIIATSGRSSAARRA